MAYPVAAILSGTKAMFRNRLLAADFVWLVPHMEQTFGVPASPPERSLIYVPNNHSFLIGDLEKPSGPIAALKI